MKLLSGNYDIYPIPYSPLHYDGVNYTLYVYKDGEHFKAQTKDLQHFTFEKVLVPYGSNHIINGKLHTAYYDQIDNQHTNYCFDLNGKQIHRKKEFHGLDITLTYAEDEFKVYARMNMADKIRTIGMMTSKDFKQWTPMKEVFVPDSSDGSEQFYSMSVVYFKNMYYGFLNLYDTINETVEIQLCKSKDGYVWDRGERKSVVDNEGRGQMFGIASVINDNIHLLSISSKFHHDNRYRQGNYYYTELFILEI